MIAPRFQLREPVVAIEYDGWFGGPAHTLIGQTLAAAFDSGDSRCSVFEYDGAGTREPYVFANAIPTILKAGDRVLLHYIDGVAASLTVLDAATFAALYVEVSP